jgi:DNA polymerase-3 subunit delta'
MAGEITHQDKKRRIAAVVRAKNQETTPFPAIDLGHRQAYRFLESCLRERVPALLFTGPEGCGKEHAAVDFARAVCCEMDPKCRLGDPELCEGCRQALALEHPGIHLIYATPTQGAREKEGDDEADVGKVLEEKRHDFFSSYVFKKKASIRIARARAVIRRANTRPFGGTHNVFIFADAHTMREEAQNSLLKLVEEPPQPTVLILITPNPDTILYTIRSRCQRVRFGPLEEPVVARILTEYYGLTADAAATAASLSRGDIRRAREIAGEYDDSERKIVYEILLKIKDAPDSWAVESALGVSRATNRDGAARFLDELATAYRDIMTGDETLFINRDQAGLLKAQSKRWNKKNLPQILDKVIGVRNGILRRNLNIDAALADLFLDIKHLG